MAQVPLENKPLTGHWMVWLHASVEGRQPRMDISQQEQVISHSFCRPFLPTPPKIARYANI